MNLSHVLAAGGPQYIELLEKNTHIVYPAIAVAVLALLAAGIIQAWRAPTIDGATKAELKRSIIDELRKQVGGSSAESLSRVVGLEPFKLMSLLEELQSDGIVGSHTNTQRLTLWQLKGGPVRGT